MNKPMTMGIDAEALLVECEPLVKQMAYNRACRYNRPHYTPDLAQAARIGLWAAAADAPVDDMHRIKWAAMVIRHRMTDHLRDELGRLGSPQDQAEMVSIEDAPEPWRECEAIELIGVLRLLESIRDLSQHHREVAEGLAAGRDRADLASELGISRPAFSLREKRVREWVRKRLG